MANRLDEDNIVTVSGSAGDTAITFPSFRKLRHPIETMLSRKHVVKDGRILDHTNRVRIAFFNRYAVSSDDSKLRCPDGRMVRNWKARVTPKAKIAAAGLFDDDLACEIDVQAEKTVATLDAVFGTIIQIFPAWSDSEFQQALETARVPSTGKRALQARTEFFRCTCRDSINQKTGIDALEMAGPTWLEEYPPHWVSAVCKALERFAQGDSREHN